MQRKYIYVCCHRRKVQKSAFHINQIVIHFVGVNLSLAGACGFVDERNVKTGRPAAPKPDWHRPFGDWLDGSRFVHFHCIDFRPLWPLTTVHFHTINRFHFQSSNSIVCWQRVPNERTFLQWWLATYRIGFGELISCGTRAFGEWSGDGLGLFGSNSSIGGVPQSSQLCCWIFGARGLGGGLRLHAILVSQLYFKFSLCC